jgi:integrase
MTLAGAPRHQHRNHDAVEQPEPFTVVLSDRRLVPGVDRKTLSLYVDDRWNLDAGIFEQHAKATSLNFALVKAPLREFAKRYIWTIINCDPPAQFRRNSIERPSLRTIASFWNNLREFLDWLHDRGVSEICQVTTELLDAYLADVAAVGNTLERKYRRIAEVRRLWTYRSALPESMRLPEMPPWGGDTARELFGKVRPRRENVTARIAERTMQRVLMWSLRFVEDFAEDILEAHSAYLILYSRGPEAARARGVPKERLSCGEAIRAAQEYVVGVRRFKASLPGKVDAKGLRAVNLTHVGKIIGIPGFANPSYRKAQSIILESGLPIDDDAYLNSQILGTIRGVPWHPGPISYYKAQHLARHLSTACLIVIAYLSGARPGEVLNLRRGCIQRDRQSDMWLMAGKEFKNARDPKGNKMPEGLIRRDPWVVIEPVARAVDILEQLHEDELLFPSRLESHRKLHNTKRAGGARVGQLVSGDMGLFIEFVNAISERLGDEVIPADPAGPLNITRFRRTLAWFIRRRPRGLVANAIQYGHLHARMTQGYAGDYDSGFPDELAFEDFLAQLEELSEDEQNLRSNEKVSGPAAQEYRQRVHAANRQFAGHVLTSNRQARDLLANPVLKIYHGDGMTCVFDATKAACQLRGTADDPMVTPDIDDCRLSCQNIARTDRDIAALRSHRNRIAEVVSDRVAPSIRHQREKRTLERIDAILQEHDDTK